MIKTLERALAIQNRRYAAGKRGIAKAVRRYLRRVDPDSYPSRRDAWPANWPVVKKARAA